MTVLTEIDLYLLTTDMSERSKDDKAKPERRKGSILIDGKRYPLPEQVLKNIETIISLQANQQRSIPWHEQLLTKIAAAFGRPQFLYAQLLFLIAWGLCSHFASASLTSRNLPTLDLGEQGIDIASLLIATGVLVRQAQQDKISEQRSHLTLQINLLNEQKIAKVIELLEELRTDTPNVRNRYDWEANVMRKATDPQVVLDILQENLEQVPAEEDEEIKIDKAAEEA